MMELYGHPFSSYTWKAQIALHANGNPHVFKMVDPGHPDNSAFVAMAHPAGKFPVLRDGVKVVFEATTIIEYLAVNYPGDAPPILDDCPRLAALRAELLALPPVILCIDAARPYRKFFPLGAPDRD